MGVMPEPVELDDADDDEEDDEDEDDVAAAVSSDDEPHAASMAGANASARGEENARTKERWAGRMLEPAEEPKQNPASIVDLSAAPSRRARSGGTREGTMGAQWKQKGREAAANAKGRIMTRLSRELMIAARDGADPTMNPRLRMAVEAARKASMTRDTMERAIKKGAGLLDEAVVFETVTYEGFTPYMVPVVVECLTDNRNRTSANIKQAFRKGQMATAGAVSWDFARLGAIEASHPSGADPDEAAIEAGAQDLEPGEEGGTTFYTEPSDLDAVSKALAERGWTLSGARLIWKAKNPIALDDDAKRTEVEAFLEALDEDDDVQQLFVGLA